ncbi:hypothetical protein GH5_05278 [Leishmania sp. Ghana 2012 LV757]|uniref:hypothetical protein n=1 Tax=Leishmania sp. Ghana 2012 LV757 TaxID=2803181 RepID=UPI001B7C2B15|nr:hypothetical protein GH5_05278 [Leishmania sp. Ghana 2012 LV757]
MRGLRKIQWTRRSLALAFPPHPSRPCNPLPKVTAAAAACRGAPSAAGSLIPSRTGETVASSLGAAPRRYSPGVLRGGALSEVSEHRLIRPGGLSRRHVPDEGAQEGRSAWTVHVRRRPGAAKGGAHCCCAAERR